MGIGADFECGISTIGEIGELGIRFPFKPVAAVEGEDDSYDTIYITPWFFDSEVQGTWTTAQNSLRFRYGNTYSTTTADGDGVQFFDYMPAGTYTCKFVTVVSTDRGILKIKIDGVTVGTFDCYAASIADSVKTQAGISISTSGVKTIQAVVDGKNDSSSGYAMSLVEILFYRTA